MKRCPAHDPAEAPSVYRGPLGRFLDDRSALWVDLDHVLDQRDCRIDPVERRTFHVEAEAIVRVLRGAA